MRLILVCLLFASATLSAHAAKPTRFWNLTNNTVTQFMLAPAGTDKYGPDQAKSDKDGSVDHDERLKLNDVASGTYDVKLADDRGRACLIKNVAVRAGEVFSIEEKQLAGTCSKQ